MLKKYFSLPAAATVCNDFDIETARLIIPADFERMIFRLAAKDSTPAQREA
jgi:hypothetical protein